MNGKEAEKAAEAKLLEALTKMEKEREWNEQVLVKFYDGEKDQWHVFPKICVRPKIQSKYENALPPELVAVLEPAIQKVLGEYGKRAKKLDIELEDVQ
jgi:hypothetical protein